MIQALLTRTGGIGPLTAGLVPLILVVLSGAWAPDLRAEPQAPATPAEPAGLTGSQAEAILEELKGIRKLLERIDERIDTQGVAQAPMRLMPPMPMASPTAEISIDGEPTLGATSAPVTVVEFTDYQCPYCLRFIRDTFTKLKQNYIDTGKVRWVVRDLPLGFHPHARKAAQAAHCAGDQGKFWEMRTVLFANARQLEREKLPQYAQVVGLDEDAFIACLASDRYGDQINQDVQDASAAKITGTPTFIIGKAADNAVDGKRIVGARDYDVFAAEIEKLLDSGGTAPAKSSANAIPADSGS